MEDSPEERVAVDDCIKPFVGEAALREVAQPIGEQADQMSDFEGLKGDLNREVTLD